MVRISKSSVAWVVTAVQLAGSVNRKETARHERALTEDESREMLAAVSGFGLWNRRDFAQVDGVMDGALWVVEGRRGTGYHPVFLVNADEGAIRKLALVFLNMARIKTSMLSGGG